MPTGKGPPTRVTTARYETPTTAMSSVGVQTFLSAHHSWSSAPSAATAAKNGHTSTVNTDTQCAVPNHRTATTGEEQTQHTAHSTQSLILRHALQQPRTDTAHSTQSLILRHARPQTRTTPETDGQTHNTQSLLSN